jgi:hypothetical protein
MKKSAFSVLVAVSTIALCLALIPNVLSQIENASILSYSYYISPYDNNYLLVVGEAQNIGPNVLGYITVMGTFYAPDGTVFMSNYARSITTQIPPQQKIPFQIPFTTANIASDTNWTFQDVTNLTVTVNYVKLTETRQYQDLTVINDSLGTDNDGYYRVTGTVKNIGSQATNQTAVVATFYNSTGSVVAFGFSDYLTPTSIPAGGTASFTIYPSDYDAVYSEITSYSLIIQTELTAPSATPTPTPSPSPSASATPTPSQSSPSPSPTPTGSGNGTTIPDTYIYIAAVAVVIVVVGVVALVLRKRAGKSTATSQQTEQQTNTTL